jgi:serine-type D-Ala-D-Ala carboxypeptidase
MFLFADEKEDAHMFQVLREGHPEEVGMSAQGIVRAEKTVQHLVDIGNTPSVVALIARDGVIVSHQAYGTNGIAPGAQALTRDAIFPVCSISKSITAACIMMLVEEGLIGLKRPICDYLPELGHDEKNNIRVNNLLTHTSGFDDGEIYKFIEQKKDVEIPSCEPYESKRVHDILYLMQDMPVTRKPGEIMIYSSLGFQMLGEIIARVSKMPFHVFVDQRLFQPLGMKDSMFYVTDEFKARVVQRDKSSFMSDWLTSDDCLVSTSAAGGMFSTAYDLAIFCSMLQNHGKYNGIRLLSPVSVIEMTRNQIPGVASTYRMEYFPEAFWGYGLGINGTKMDGAAMFSPQAYSHWGAAGVFFCVDPVYRTIQIYLSVEVIHERIGFDIYADVFNDVALSAIETL